MKEPKEIIIPTNPADLQKIASAIQEISNALTRIDGEKAYIKEAVEDISEKFELPKAFVNKIAKIFYTQSLDQKVSEANTLEEAYSKIFPGRSV